MMADAYLLPNAVFIFSSIYVVHDEVKDKAFELELSWVGEGKAVLPYIPNLVCYVVPM